MALSAGKKILTLGKEALDKLGNTKLTDKLKKIEKDFRNTGGKKKKVTKVIKKTDTPVKKLASDATTKRNIKSNISKSEKVFNQKEYNKKLFDTLKKNQKNKISKNTTKNKTKQSTDLVPTGQSKTIKETVNPKKIKQNFKLQGKPVDKTPKINKPKKQSTALVTIPKSVTTKTDKIAYLKKFAGKNWKQIAATLGLLSSGFLISKDTNTSNASISDGGNKNKKPPKDSTSKNKTPNYAGSRGIPKGNTKKDTPKKTKSDDYTGRFIDKKGDVAYDSASDFFAHMFGTPKKRKMPKKTARIIGTGDKLKRKDADKKGAGKGVKFKAFKSGTKDKTIGLKDLPPKSQSPGIHKLPAKAKINMGFKPMFGGGFISSLYDKPEKTEKHKGNTTSARQVKGYGKAKKKN